MHTYRITQPDGSTNTIVADAAFVEQYYPGAELIEPPPAPEPEAPAGQEAAPNTAGTLLAAIEAMQLMQLKAAQGAAIDAASEAEAARGFISTALHKNKPHRYPNTPADAAVLAANLSASLMPELPANWSAQQLCTDDKGEQAYRKHSAEQIQQAAADAREDAARREAKRAMLQSLIAAATTPEDVRAVTWEGESP